MLFTGNNGNSIFLPAEGLKRNTNSAGKVVVEVYYWNSTRRDDAPEIA